MKQYFSNSTKGFYIEGMHKNIPEDAVEITEEERLAVIVAQSDTKCIDAGENGKPIIVDRVRTVEELSRSARKMRDMYLKSCDWVILRAQETGEPIPQAWLDYRQALRDVPQQAGFPQDIQWPTKPQSNN